MNRLRRLTLVLTLALAVALVSACKDQSSSNKTPNPAAGAVAGGGGDPTQFIPADMDFLLKVEWANSLSAKNNTEEFRKGFREGVTKGLSSKDPMAGEIFKALDIDILTDVQGFATGAKINPVTPGEGDAVIALKTKLQLEKLVSVLKEKAAGKVVIAPYDAGVVKGYELSDPAGSTDNKMYLASSGDVIVGATTSDYLKQAFDTQKNGTSSFKAGKLKDAMSLVDSSAQFIFVLDGTKIPKDPNSPPPMPGVDQMQVVAASLKYASQQYDLAIVARFPEAQIAKTLADQLIGMKGMFGGSPEMKPLADKILIAAAQTDLKINASITDKEIEDLQKQMEQKAPGMMPGQMPAGQ